MPPPSYCSKVNTPSSQDPGNENDLDNSRSEISSSENDFKSTLKTETVGIVKSLLGPSLEDAVLRTLEFGKYLMQKPEPIPEEILKDKRLLKKLPKEIKELTEGSAKDLNLEALLEESSKGGFSGIKNKPEEKEEKKCLAVATKPDKEQASQKSGVSARKVVNVSKIRSLDSDLKQNAPSPEKIKKQLEALIQINKDEPIEHCWNLIASKASKVPMEMTVMPSLCMYKNEAEKNYSSSCDVQSQASKAGNDCSDTTSRVRSKKRHPNKICQAPEFLSNALGPTIDVSIIDNLKMMRDIFKYESGKGEGSVKEHQQMKQEIRLQNSEGEMACRIEELQRKIEELEQKEQCLINQIEEEEQERECKRKAFEAEEKKLCEMKICMEGLGEGKKRDVCRPLMECSFDGKFESLQSRIANEEEKLSRLKCQYDQYKREIAEAKYKREALKRNKSLLDAWDIFASRVCHTRLPSFSRAFHLERKQFKSEDSVNLHCCFPNVTNPPESPKSCCMRTNSRVRCRSDHRCCSRGSSQCDVSAGKEQECHANLKGKIKMGEVQFPIQRDIICGLHQMLKTCTCSSKAAVRVGGQACSSEDDLLKKCKMEHGNYHRNYGNSLGIESSAEMLLRDTSCDKPATRSKSDTSIKREACSKIVKVMWAVTRINIFQNNYRTYEIMDATCTPPPCPPVKTEGIFVVKTSHRKSCPSPTQKKCHPSATAL